MHLPLFVLSAKYGSVRADEAIDPYDLTIRQLPEAAKAEWAARVAKTLMSKQRRVAKVLILADDEYAEPLAPLFIERAINLLRPTARSSAVRSIAPPKRVSSLSRSN
jgi:hypothetical protein